MSDTARRWYIIGVAFIAASAIAAVARSEPPQCNLPGWGQPAVTVHNVVVHQSSSSHTHACPNADCPFAKYYGEPYVWGGANHSHKCAYCKTEQTVAATVVTGTRQVGRRLVSVTANRPITVVRQVSKSSPAVYTPQPVETKLLFPVRYYSNCANGNCSTVTYR